MIEHHDTYDHKLEDYTINQIRYAFEDVFTELDVISAKVTEDQQARLLLAWVRYAVQNVLDSYTE